MRLASAACVMFLAATGCALAPQHHVYLEQAETAYVQAASDRRVASLAPAELQSAGELLERAVQARATLQDAAEVDHLAYLVKQRTAIAIEAARQRGTEP